MGRAPSHKKERVFAKKVKYPTRCERQFPDCPEEPNEEACRNCPFYKK